MNAKEIRRKFLDFFKEKGHEIVPSAPLVVKNDPTLMFTNAGMNQFKDYFLGNKKAESPRIADTQKCLRVSGKHNDLEEVGLDTYHHTMFEMLGNWSFGNYFKKDAIAWAWELLTEVYQLPKDRLYVTVFEGDQVDKLEPDTEAFDIWKKYIDENRIIYASKKDNFWEMGNTGPCGPCSEIHIDLRDEADIAKKSGKDLVNQDDPLVVEIWNLVFIQFNRIWDSAKGGAAELKKFEQEYKGDDASKAASAKHSELTILDALPDKHVDTGMGFERLAMAIQKQKSNYDTDVFQPMIQFIAKETGQEYHCFEAKTGLVTTIDPLTGSISVSGPDADNEEKKAEAIRLTRIDIAMRVMADHIRAITFSIADGQMLESTGAGYVIRRILRRAVRYGYTYLELREPFLYKLSAILAEQFDDIFPEVKAQLEYIQKIIKSEEKTFLSTLETGVALVNEQLAKGIDEIPGDVVFKLKDTFGFPVDLTELIAREHGVSIDMEGYNKALEDQKNRSRSESEKGNWITVREGDLTEFIGYDFTESPVQILRYREVTEEKTEGKKKKKVTYFQVVLNKTPFYAESGGQVGDTGLLINGEEKISVTDTQKENDLIIHYTNKLPENPAADFEAKVNVAKRALTANNHSATHLLHAALKEVLGDHVAQKGSLVHDKGLRFDFSHFQAMTPEEIAKVETLVNQKVRENIELLEKRNVPIDDAKAMGATALFGEKYGDFVRVITFDSDYSVELCGGIHVPATGKIGLLKITSESSVAAGVRRLEAITAERAENFVNEQLDLVNDIKAMFKNPKDLRKTVEKLVEEKQQLEKQIAAYQQKELVGIKEQLLQSQQAKDGINFIAQQVALPNADGLRQIAFELKQKIDNLFLVLAADIDGKPQIGIMISDNLVTEKGYNAGKMIRELAKEIKGGGGGQAFFATAGGKDLSGLGNVVKKAEELI